MKRGCSTRQKCPEVRFLKADLTKPLRFSEGQFDKINCAQALKHIRDIGSTLQEFCRVLRAGGKIVFSVTHPEMDWNGFEMKPTSHFVLTEHSDIFHHRFMDYFDAFDLAKLKIDRIRQIPISSKIKHLLTLESYEIVKGRYEVIVFRLMKP